MSVGQAGAVNVNIFVDGKHVPDEHHISFVVERDINQPDMATIVLSNQNNLYTGTKVGASIEIKIGKDNKSIYKGDMVGLEPVFKGGEKSRITLRAMNKMHKLIQQRKSRTWSDKTDQQILSDIVKDAGLTLDFKHEKTLTYKHVYQHNQSNMEFLRTRAARIGCHLWCVDTTLHCKQPDLTKESGIVLAISDDVGGSTQLKSFSPRVSSAPIYKKVTVKGWNPETKELLQGNYSAQNSPLGAQNASAASGDQGSQETFTVDHPIWSNEEAEVLAKAKLVEANLQHVTGEAESVGDPSFDLATVVRLKNNTEHGGDTFNGKYYVMGVTQRHTAGGKDRGGGFTCQVKLARDAQGGP